MGKEIHNLEIKPEKALLMAVAKKGADKDSLFEQLNELESLAETAGAEVLEKHYQELAKPSPATAIGKGKIEELRLIILEEGINIIIFDDDLSPAQVRNLENELKIKVIDRSGLILDIFANNAKTLEAKTQVELAQLQYLLPRLTRMWTHLSKQYGGIGTKGPGETQIETDRRIVREKIQKLKEDLKQIDIQRQQQRKKRALLPRFALVGYTNAGKSTLMNALTNSGVYVEDKLFATLDTTVRSFELGNGQKALISDTVGFIRKLPAHLVASFRSTLAEAAEADILLHVVDVSHPFFREHIKVVEATLESLKITDKPTILCLNKIDNIQEDDFLKSIEMDYYNGLLISADKGYNIEKLLAFMQDKYEEFGERLNLVLPYSYMNLISSLYESADILLREDKDDGIHLKVKVAVDNKEIFKHIFRNFIIEA